MRRCPYFYILAISTLFTLVGTAWGEEGSLRHGPMLRDLQKEENTRSVTEMIVSLKPHARAYVDRHYEWASGQVQDQRDEAPMGTEVVRKLSKAAGVQLKLKPVDWPKDLRTREGALMTAEEALKLSKVDGLKPHETVHLFTLPSPITPKEARAIAARLAKHPDVEFAGPNLIGYGMRVPNDAMYQSLQWNFQQSSGGVNLPPAWDTTIGGTNIVVAVLDSGILPNHADIVGRTVPGYDFVNNPVIAGDGGGRDADSTDPGTWVTQADIAANPTSLSSCVIPAGQTIHPSSWHGTHVAGVMGANRKSGSGFGYCVIAIEE